MPSHEPEELVEIGGYAAIPGDDPLGRLIPVRIKVPSDHPYLTAREGDRLLLDGKVAIRVEDQLGLERPEPHEFTREISRAVAEHATRTATLAREQYRLALRANLEVMRQSMTVAIQQRLSAYFGECQRDDRRPLTWDSASHAVDAAIDFLAREFTP